MRRWVAVERDGECEHCQRPTQLAVLVEIDGVIHRYGATCAGRVLGCGSLRTLVGMAKRLMDMNGEHYHPLPPLVF